MASMGNEDDGGYGTLNEVNRYWNHAIKGSGKNGTKIHNLQEMLDNGAECHDWVKFKAVGLKGKGYDMSKVRVGAGLNKDGIPHSVLIIGDNDLVLDNQTDEIKSLSDRPDLNITYQGKVADYRWFDFGPKTANR